MNATLSKLLVLFALVLSPYLLLSQRTWNVQIGGHYGGISERPGLRGDLLVGFTQNLDYNMVYDDGASFFAGVQWMHQINENLSFGVGLQVFQINHSYQYRSSTFQDEILTNTLEMDLETQNLYRQIPFTFRYHLGNTFFDIAPYATYRLAGIGDSSSAYSIYFDENGNPKQIVKD